MDLHIYLGKGRLLSVLNSATSICTAKKFFAGKSPGSPLYEEGTGREGGRRKEGRNRSRREREREGREGGQAPSNLNTALNRMVGHYTVSNLRAIQTTNVKSRKNGIYITLPVCIAEVQLLVQPVVCTFKFLYSPLYKPFG
jgi:hypothetical protein